ncbi:glycosyltransferase [Marinobacter aromaticivorans]|uniref:Glycosyltransferase n=1 Tax=Marinobacter aromaticivorans TaxID=1494078 RepID=A0ABW2ITT2_9GAMM|nr:glycosyltransferase [Marinobacter aromaticivorans]
MIIPIFNEEQFIVQCYESLISCLDESKLSYEIVIIDNGSSDQTPALLKSFKNASVYNIPRSTISYARNVGASKSKGNVLAFIDGDVVVNDVWVDSVSRFVEDRKTPFLTGYEVIIREKPSWIEKHWFGNLASNHINSANLIISRSAFDMLGGFNEDLKTGEDYDLCDRAKKNNNIYYCPVKSFEAIHLGYPSTLSGFIKRELWHGEGDFSSFKTFLSSKVALLSVFYFAIQVHAIAFFVVGCYLYGLIFMFFLCSLNIYITSARFKNKPLKTLVINNFLNYCYFSARFGSLFLALARRSRKY